MMPLSAAFGEGSSIPAYLRTVASIHREVLGPDLTALYLHGSVVQGDFQAALSDLDILGVVSGAIDEAQRAQLIARLRHEALPVPAIGLELIICSVDAVREPVAAMPFEFALSTGAEWGTQVEDRGTTSDILVNMQLCRQAALALEGARARDILAPVPIAALRAALMGELLWHRNDLRDRPAAQSPATQSPATQSIVNAVLNSARSVYAAETGQVVSKTEGGKRWLRQKPGDRVVAQAMEYREGKRGALAPDLQSARNFLESVIAAL